LDRTGTLLMRLGFVERLDQKLLEDEFDRLKSNPVKISAIMSSPAVTVGVNESLAVAAGIMAKNKIKRLPVVHDDGRLAGVISRLDVLRQVIHEKPKKPKTLLPVGASRTVREIMLDDVPIIDQDADLGALVSAFVSHWYHRLIIVNEEGKAIGLVNDADVINRIHPSERRGVLKALQQRGPIPVSKYKAIDLMSAGVLKALPDTSVLDAIRMMVSQGRKWLVVVDSDDKPLGLVDRQTLLRAVTID
jgi:predicted transcriptional regulator